MQIQMKLKDIVANEALREHLDINPYAINEGADPESLITVDVKFADLKPDLPD